MKRNLQGYKIGISMVTVVFSTFAGAAITDIDPKDIKGTQLLMSRMDAVVSLEEAHLIVFQHVSSCNPGPPATFLFGLTGKLTDSQKLRQRFCAAIRKALTTQGDHGREQRVAARVARVRRRSRGFDVGQLSTRRRKGGEQALRVPSGLERGIHGCALLPSGVRGCVTGHRDSALAVALHAFSIQHRCP